MESAAGGGSGAADSTVTAAPGLTVTTTGPDDRTDSSTVVPPDATQEPTSARYLSSASLEPARPSQYSRPQSRTRARPLAL